MRAQVGRDGRAAHTCGAVRPARAAHIHAVLDESSRAGDIVPAVYALVVRREGSERGRISVFLCASAPFCMSVLRARSAILFSRPWFLIGFCIPIGALASFRSLLYTLACMPSRVASILHILLEDCESTNERHTTFSSDSDKKGWGWWCSCWCRPGRGGQCNGAFVWARVMQGRQGAEQLHASWRT